MLKDISQQAMVQNNPWTESKISKGERDGSCRKKMEKLLGCNKKTKKPKCSVTGIRGNASEVICAHIIPCSSTSHQLIIVGLTVRNVNETKNLVFLAYGIERCFDKLQLSFMKTNPLEDKLTLKIWDDDIRNHLIFPGSSQRIGGFDGAELKLEHTVYKRLLAFQAYQACKKYGFDDDNTLSQTRYGSPGSYPFKNQSEIILENFHRTATEEIDVEEDDLGDENESLGASGGGEAGEHEENN